MRHHELRRFLDVADGHVPPAVKRRERRGRLYEQQLAAVPLGVRVPRELGRYFARALLDLHFRQQPGRTRHRIRKALVRGRICAAKARPVALIGQPPADDFGALEHIRFTCHVHIEAKFVEQLRPQAAFLRVHRTHEDEAAFVAQGNPLTLHDVFAQSGGA